MKRKRMKKKRMKKKRMKRTIWYGLRIQMVNTKNGVFVA
tara:strand:- start:316 stop:432 length:117 start_codon:yes stop_codon:yes gene_type:complete